MIFGFCAHVFAIKGTYVVYSVTYHVMHMLKGPPTLHLKKFPRRITLALEKTKKKKKEEKIGLLIVRVGVVLSRNVVDSEIIFLTSQSFG